MAQFLDYDGLLYFYQKLKSKFNYVSPATTNPVMDGTAAVGSSDKYARADHVHPTDTSRAQTNHSSSATTYGTGTNSLYGHVKLSDSINSTTAASSGGTAATPKAVSDAIAAAIKYCDDNDTDTTYTLVQGNNDKRKVSLVPDGGTGTTIETFDTLYEISQEQSATDGTTIKITPDKQTGTVVGDGSSEITLTTALWKIFTGATTSDSGVKGLVPAPSSGQEGAIMWGDGTWQAPYLSASATSGSLKLSLYGASQLYQTEPSTGSISGSKLATAIGTNAVARATGDASGNAIASTYAKLASPSLTGTPTAPTASAGTNSTQIATTAFVTTAVANAQSGAAMFKGTLGTSTSTSTYTQSTLQSSAYKVGWYWVVNVAGTYVGKTCGVGDMVYCVKDKGSAYAASDFTVVQNEMDAITNAQIDTIVAS